MNTPEKKIQITLQEYQTLETVKHLYINAVLAHTKGKKTEAAKILGINRRTLYRLRPVKDVPAPQLPLGR